MVSLVFRATAASSCPPMRPSTLGSRRIGVATDKPDAWMSGSRAAAEVPARALAPTIPSVV